MKLHPIPYYDQEAEDYCGSSAVMIDLEMARIYKNHSFLPKRLDASPDILNKFKSRLHKTEGEKITQKAIPLHLRKKMSEWTFSPESRTGGRRSINQHIRICPHNPANWKK